jgi:MFS family permease
MQNTPASGSDSPATTRGVWKVGTLSYTAFGLVALMFWLFWGDVAWALRERSVPSVMQLLFQKFGASNLISGLLISTLPNVMILLIGPVISYRSDRHRSRWGRRIPYLIGHIPFAVLSIFAVAFSPQLGQGLRLLLGPFAPSLSACTLIVIALGWAIFELATVVANSVFYALINDVVPSKLLGRFYGIFRAISLSASILFNWYVFGSAEKHFPLVFIGIGVVYGVSFALMCLRVKEGSYPPPAEHKEGGGSFFTAAGTYFRECFSNPYYLWVFAAISLPWISFIGVNHFSVYFAKSLSMDMSFYGKCLAVTYTCSLVLSYPLGMLADRFHPLRTSMVVIFLYSVVTASGAIFATTPGVFSIFFVLHGVLSGAWMTSAASLPMRMFPKENFSQFYSALYMFIGLGIMIAGPTIGQLIDLSDHFYRLTFIASSILSALAVVFGIVVHGKFLKLGGPSFYQPPA